MVLESFQPSWKGKATESVSSEYRTNVLHNVLFLLHLRHCLLSLTDVCLLVLC